jgi:hypothetical protein
LRPLAPARADALDITSREGKSPGNGSSETVTLSESYEYEGGKILVAGAFGSVQGFTGGAVDEIAEMAIDAVPSTAARITADSTIELGASIPKLWMEQEMNKLSDGRPQNEHP